MSLAEHLVGEGGHGLEVAKSSAPFDVIAELERSGLRGRGGAGFPTGTKWRTVLENRSPMEPSTVVVNGAEGEPGTFKDRTILRMDPYRVLEGAIIASHVIGANLIVIALKKSFTTELARVREAVAEIRDAGWLDDVEVAVFEGPHHYLYGEETALLEAIDGRQPFPRIAPPFRRGLLEIVETDDDAVSHSNLSAHVEMAGADSTLVAPPTLVDNVETLANVPRIVSRGADWFRTEGTEASPGTVVCTITGATRRHGVGEVIMGTTLREAIEEIGGGPKEGRHFVAALPGVSGALIPEAVFDTPLSYEAMAGIGSGLGSAGFILFDDTADLTAVAAGASRFLAVESCGQCTPCKQDGLALSQLLERLARSELSKSELAAIVDRTATVADEARCSLATQHQTIVASLLQHFPGQVQAHLSGQTQAREPEFIAELVDIESGRATWDEAHRAKQPDWRSGPSYSGQAPADWLDDHRAPPPNDLAGSSGPLEPPVVVPPETF
jgi:NADH:ubiquinone oxidoreductase subunit F (NADH-binding)